MGKILKCDHSDESWRAVLSCGAVSYTVKVIQQFSSLNKILKCDHVMKATECYFPVVLFLFNTVQKTEFKSLNLHLFFFWNVDIFGRNRSFWNRKHEIHGEYNYSLVCLRTIGHLWVVWDLITKARLSAKFFMWKLVVFFFSQSILEMAYYNLQ